MKRAALAAFLFVTVLATSMQAQFIVRSTNEAIFLTGSEPQLLFLRSDDASYYVPPRTWQTYDLKRIDPRFAGVVSIDVEGMLVITGDNNPSTLCQIQVQFRHLGVNAAAGNYQWQQIIDGGWSYEAENGGSVRTPVPNVQQDFTTITLNNGTFEYWWAFEPSCASLVNLKIKRANLP
jgi:hypothetical protein